jgi:alkylated DNA repair protein (DNA oxidative demethylase)
MATHDEQASEAMKMDDLFGDADQRGRREILAEGALLLRRFALDDAARLLQAVQQISAEAPFRHMVTPGGYRMSVAMTNCGSAGWVTDRAGYRYQATDPQSGRPWPVIPAALAGLARQAATEAGFPAFRPDACLINRYTPGARLSLHQDRNERDLQAPVVSVSLGLPAVFLFGGLRRTDRVRRYRLEHGDVVVWGGPARLAFHGIAPLAEDHHPATGNARINLTFRQAL